MANPGLTPLPPTIHHSSTQVSHLAAHTTLSSFLTLAALDPSLRPDSVLSARGPTSSSSAANPNLTLAHLGRIKLGMEGKRSQTMKGAADYDATDGPEFWGVGGPNRGAKRKRQFGHGDDEDRRRKNKKAHNTSSQTHVQTVENGHDTGELALFSSATAQGDAEWQDRENYDLAQDDDEVDVGNTQRNAGAGLGDVEETVGTEGADGEVVKARSAEVTNREKALGPEKDAENVEHRSGEGKTDKEERKRLKREKRKKEKREKEKIVKPW